MRYTFRKQQAALAVACCFALGVFSSVAGAQAMSVNETARVVDSQGNPVMSGHGLCWHTGYGPAPSWNATCNDGIPAPIAQAVEPAPAAVATPEPAPTPAPEPVVAAPAAPVVVYESFKYDADILFDSGKSDLRPESREALDAFIGKLQGLESAPVLAIGHADRMGAEDANQTLSEARVNAVKSYLVSKGVAAERVQASAVGETQPLTAQDECKEPNKAANIACMQPDRRVLIEVSGSRIVQ